MCWRQIGLVVPRACWGWGMGSDLRNLLAAAAELRAAVAALQFQRDAGVFHRINAAATALAQAEAACSRYLEPPWSGGANG